MARVHDNLGGKHGSGLVGRALGQQLRREREGKGEGQGVFGKAWAFETSEPTTVAYLLQEENTS